MQKLLAEGTAAINSAQNAEEVRTALSDARGELLRLEETRRQQQQEREYRKKLGMELTAISLAAVISLLTAMISLINHLLGSMSFTF